MKIYINRIQCRICKDIIESQNIHEVKFCKCGKVGVDGGKDYLRRIGKKKDIIEMSKYISQI